MSAALIALLPMIIQGVQAAIQAAPGVIDVVQKGKALISSLFVPGNVSREDQDKIMAHIDLIEEMVNRGEVPPAWQVEADPV